MLRKDRLRSSFMELLRFNSPSKREGTIAGYLSNVLKDMGLSLAFDSAHRKTGGDVGNLIASLPGDESLPPLMLNAHLDTIEPTENIVIECEGDIIKSDGNTILGADDKSGIACILEILRTLREDNIPHPTIYVVFTVCEEIGLLGAKNLDYSLVSAKMGFVLDTGPPFKVIFGAPYHNRIDLVVRGRESHAGVSPSKGINAIKVASDAISKITTGKIDEETTANIGVIKGGTATNIIPGMVEIKAEVRSHDEEKLERKTKDIVTKFQNSCDLFETEIDGNKYKPTIRCEIVREYNAFRLDRDEELIRRLFEAADWLNIKLETGLGGGGSDGNIFNERGIKTVLVGTGMTNPHAKNEHISLEDMFTCASLLVRVISTWGCL